MTGKKVGFLAAMLMSASLAMPVLAQTDTATTQPAAPAQGGNGNNGGRRNFDPAQMRQRMLDTLKDRLGATDDEFAAIQPKLEKVMQLQRDVNGGGMRALFGGGRRRGGENGGTTPAATPGGATPSAVQAASTDLQTTLDNKDAKPDEIKAKLDAFRDAKSKAKDDLTAAQKDLESVLTQRQEAMLVMMGLLN
jgi:hypothetical protein